MRIPASSYRPSSARSLAEVVHLTDGAGRLRSLDATPRLERAAMEGLGLVVASGLLVMVREIPHGVERARMVGAEDTQPRLEIVLVEWLRLLEAPACAEHVGQVHLVRHRIFVVVAEPAARDVVRFSKQRLGLVESSLAPVEVRQLIHRADGLLMLGAECAAP